MAKLASMTGFSWDSDRAPSGVKALARQFDAYGSYLDSVHSQLTASPGLPAETFTSIPGADDFEEAYKRIATSTATWAKTEGSNAHAVADALVANFKRYTDAEKHTTAAVQSVAV
jgi:hypothetical protein